MLYNKEFLEELDKYSHKNVYARITALTFEETPIEYIEGRVTQGSVNVDGTSAVRRTCSLTITAQDFDYHDYYWGLETKFKLEVGLENHIDDTYPDIIWFKQGLYLITSFNTSRSTNSFNISIQGKDKMCLLNGEVGGSIVESSIDFGTIEEETSSGVWEIRKVPIQEIIKNIVHIYAKEPYHNIIINDLETYGLELLEYRYDTPMYLLRKEGNPIYENAVLNGDKVKGYVDGEPISLSKLDISKLDLGISSLITNTTAIPTVTFSGKPYHVAKVQYGQAAGYRISDLVYAGELIAKAGESIVSVLDKIKTMLTEFEYFYNLDGQFIFQKKQSFKKAMWNFVQEESYDDLVSNDGYAYKFYGGNLITAFNNNPNLLNLKNDFSIWGERESASGAKIPIHLRYAIDKKPTAYTCIKVSDLNEDLIAYNNKYHVNISEQASKSYTTEKYDWREIIYQMALDYYKYNFLDDFSLRVAEANPDLYPTGQTGYEQYYTDMQGFWRDLYNPDLFKEDEDDLYDPDLFKEGKDDYYNSGDKKYWNKKVVEAPETINFWIDFLDNTSELAQFNVKSIGSRTKTINDTNIKSIYFKDIPSIIYGDSSFNGNTDGFRYIKVPMDMDQMFSISAQGKSAKDKLDELLYQHSYCIESATITSIPIYYLNPNVRIYVNDEDTGIHGDYIVSKFSIPLTYNGTMSITATKAAEDIL